VKVIIRRTHAPIPDPRVRYQATLEDYQGGDPIGHGARPGDAVNDLIMELEVKGGYQQIDVDSM
jgi:hypothetical protein